MTHQGEEGNELNAFENGDHDETKGEKQVLGRESKARALPSQAFCTPRLQMTDIRRRCRVGGECT
jgi:hypothetical protein